MVLSSTGSMSYKTWNHSGNIVVVVHDGSMTVNGVTVLTRGGDTGDTGG